jgi:hypothetical protein
LPPLQLAGHAIKERRLLFSRQSDRGLLDYDPMAWLQGEHVISWWKNWPVLVIGANGPARRATVMPGALSRQ